jgi:uncharacterized protein
VKTNEFDILLVPGYEGSGPLHWQTRMGTTFSTASVVEQPYASLEEQAAIAQAWGSQLVEAGAVGHINTASGHGPWPEGMQRFADFLSNLS